MRTSFLRESPFAILPGQYFDAETGLHQNWHRDYGPSIGRYLQSDPIGLAGGLSTFGYGLANPLRYFDSTGLIAPDDLGKAIGRKGGKLDSCTMAVVAAIASGDVAALDAVMECVGAVPPGLADRLRNLCRIQKRPNNVPDNWVVKQADDTKDPLSHGVEYVDPTNSHNRVRVMPGNPSSPYPNSQQPYVRMTKDGHATDQFGNPVPKNSPEAHIPLDDFLECGCTVK